MVTRPSVSERIFIEANWIFWPLFTVTKSVCALRLSFNNNVNSNIYEHFKSRIAINYYLLIFQRIWFRGRYPLLGIYQRQGQVRIGIESSSEFAHPVFQPQTYRCEILALWPWKGISVLLFPQERDDADFIDSRWNMPRLIIHLCARLDFVLTVCLILIAIINVDKLLYLL